MRKCRKPEQMPKNQSGKRVWKRARKRARSDSRFLAKKGSRNESGICSRNEQKNEPKDSCHHRKNSCHFFLFEHFQTLSDFLTFSDFCSFVIRIRQQTRQPLIRFCIQHNAFSIMHSAARPLRLSRSFAQPYAQPIQALPIMHIIP